MHRRQLRLGVHVPPEGRDFTRMREFCTEAEKLEYDLFTITDHFMNMRNPAGRKNHPLECWTTLAGLAAVTSKIILGPMVSCVNYRCPTVLAKMATTVDIISDGRLLFGIGAGWHEMEFKGFMGRFPSPRERLDGLEDAVQICRSMFENEFTSFAGKLYSTNNTLNSPSPVQNSIPIMVGGSGERRTLKIAAKHADISHLFVNSRQELEHKLQVLRKHCTGIGRNFSEISIAVGVRPLLDTSPDRIKAEAKRIAERGRIPIHDAEKSVESTAGANNLLKTIQEYHRLGVSLITLAGIDIEEMKSFKDQVASSLSQ